MYSMIAVPVDLEHLEHLGKALRTAADLAKHYGAKVCYVGATTETPGPLGHTPDEYREKLDAFAKAESAQHGIDARARTIVCLDPTIDMDRHLVEAFEAEKADLIVMASHIPGFKDHFISSNAAWIAGHVDLSVFIVR
jgi:nucleotide-binding universal stress UspA family protein